MRLQSNSRVKAQQYLYHASVQTCLLPEPGSASGGQCHEGCQELIDRCLVDDLWMK